MFLHKPSVTCLSVCPPQVQLQLLTAIVKLFLKKPTETQELVQQVLSLATQVGNTWESFPGLPIPWGSGNGVVMWQQAGNWSLIQNGLGWEEP